MREAQNKLTIVGTLKDKKVKYGTTKAGDAYISVDLTVQSEEQGKINVHKVNLWAKQSSKLAKGFNTVAEEYKTINEHGAEAADRIQVDGSLDMNEYVKDGELKTFTKIKGIFVSRVDETVADVSGVKIECVVMNNQPEIKNGTTTGRVLTKLFSVGYNNSINEFNNVVVEKELAQQYQQMFPVGTTANFFVRLDNYVVVEETAQAENAPMAFGQALAGVGASTVKNYVNENVIVGGLPVVMGKYTNEDIQEMNKLRELAKNEKLQAPSTPPATSQQAAPAAQPSFGSMPF